MKMDFKCALETEVVETVVDKDLFRSNSLDEILAIYEWYKQPRKHVKETAAYIAEQEVRGALGERLVQMRNYWSQFGFMDHSIDGLLDKVMQHVTVHLSTDQDDDQHSGEDEDFL